MNTDDALREIIADANIAVGWKEYGEHIRKGGANDLAARVSFDIARKAFDAGMKWQEELSRYEF